MDARTQSILLIIAAVGAQLAILVAAVFAGMAARDARRIALDTKAETQAQTTKIDTVAKDTAVVLGHVNSEKSVSEGEKNTLKAENALLREMIADKRSTAALLAQAASHPAAVALAAAAPAAEPRTHDTRAGDHVAEPDVQKVEVVNDPLLTSQKERL